ncbi:MAG: hypothetical protein KGH94_04100 [Candidatus Micrarchaeota archaeon]|nr:hypothetical protein [Candidatus Micrarchaeota archaeon]
MSGLATKNVIGSRNLSKEEMVRIALKISTWEKESPGMLVGRSGPISVEIGKSAGTVMIGVSTTDQSTNKQVTLGESLIGETSPLYKSALDHVEKCMRDQQSKFYQRVFDMTDHLFAGERIARERAFTYIEAMLRSSD